MAGLYIHIPFCRSRCIYCGFYSTTLLTIRQTYVDALCQELASRNADISTIYLGGGTPSMLTIPQLQQLTDAVYLYNKVESDAEVTIECNPDDITDEFAEGLSSLPFNRVSMGAQTFNDNRLRFLHRRHTANQVSLAVKRLRQAGIHNISIDLMYGFPDETLKDWQADINAALSLGVEHFSSYCLTIEEGTPLQRLMNANPRIASPDEEQEREMYFTLIDHLTAAGYEHYEISNFARPNFRSRHNSNYWQAVPYIGIGAAAHSFDGTCRSWNVSDIHQYIEGIRNGTPHYDYERLDEDTRYNDTITIRLRTCEGIDLDSLSPQHREFCLKAAQKYISDHLLEMIPDHRLKLTRQGLFVSDMVMSDLMMV